MNACLLTDRDMDDALNDAPEPPDPWELVAELRDKLAAAELKIAQLSKNEPERSEEPTWLRK